MAKETEIVRVVEDKVKNAENQVGQYAIIETEEENIKATELLANVKKLGKFATGEKEKITKPLNDALKAARVLFAPIEDKVAGMEALLKRAIVAYSNAKEKKRLEAEAKIAARVDKGTMKPETALGKLGEIGEEQKAVHTEAGSVQFKLVRKVRFTNPAELLPADRANLARDGYLVWDEVRARKDALAGGIKIPGVEVYEEKQASVL